ncbi:MAG: ATP-binding protein [Gammaproteobacteria bacterium]
MERQIESYLVEWLNSSNRKPLILRGARQVGKTWIVRQLAQKTGRELVELNLEQNAAFIDFFQDNNPQTVLMYLKSFFKKEFEPKQSLLFLDEIQAAPQLLAKLRWFAEEMPELPVIAAGSLLDFCLNEYEYSMPVGRVTYAYLEPLSFEEFLLANGYLQLNEFLNQWNLNSNIPEPIHETLTNLLREYFFVGGMPEAVSAWKKTRSFLEINKIHHDLLTSFRNDFAKYAKRIPHHRLDEVIQSIPDQLGEKFQYRRVNPDISSTQIKQALEQLCTARLCQKVQDTAAAGLPLAANINQKIFKIILLDIGLVSSLLGLHFHENLTDKHNRLMNEGGLAEQFIGQTLKTLTPFYIDPQLYYWVREEKTSSAELDFLITHDGKMVPIEVKAGSTGRLKSLHLFMALRELTVAVRFNNDKPSVTEINIKSAIGKIASYRLISLPLYLSNQIMRLLDDS